jgi:hypothetical protein
MSAVEGYQRYKARIASDDRICFRGWSLRELADGGTTWRLATMAYRIRSGETFEGQSFEYWRAFLEERGGAAVVEMITDHYNPPDFPCPPGGCPQHPCDAYEDMARQVEHWSVLLRKRAPHRCPKSRS